MNDPIDTALDDVNASLTSCLTGARVAIASAAATLTDANSYVEAVAGPGGDLFHGFALAESILEGALPMCYDVQISAASTYIAKLVAGQALTPIEWMSGDYHLMAEPIDRLNIRLNDKVVPARLGCAVLVSKWEVRLNGAAPRTMDILLECRLDVRKAWPSITLQLSRYPVFLGEDGNRSDPISDIPIDKNHSRVTAREELCRQIATSLAKTAIDLPDLGSELSIGDHPLTALLDHRLTILFKLPTIPQRRAVYAIATNLPGPSFDVGVRIKSEVIVEKLQRFVSSIPNASVHNPRYASGWFLFNVYIHREEHRCIATADIRVTVEYRAYVYNSSAAALSFRALMSSWRASWDIDWCFNKCDEASDEIEKAIRSEMKNHEVHDVQLANLWTIAKRANGHADGFGIAIQWEAR